ncbi:MAG: apolipoprotein N-acyltransferase, partial [Bacteroidales bacterium]|nr:apolipoprotein N-acyltransferase [Bacteroidales bacterium]
TIWGYGTQNARTSFIHSATGNRIAPVICYESVFGDFVAGFVREGAEVLAIITNDGWWKNTKGYYQHLEYSSLRAIETRRPVLRCANTGISCITDIRGKRLQETEWWTKSSLKGTIAPETKITFYVRAGDYIFNAASVISIIILICIFSHELKRRIHKTLYRRKWPDS